MLDSLKGKNGESEKVERKVNEDWKTNKYKMSLLLSLFIYHIIISLFYSHVSID